MKIEIRVLYDDGSEQMRYTSPCSISVQDAMACEVALYLGRLLESIHHQGRFEAFRRALAQTWPESWRFWVNR